MVNYGIRKANQINDAAKRIIKQGKSRAKAIRKRAKPKKADSGYNSSDESDSYKRIDLNAAKYRKTYMNKIK